MVRIPAAELNPAKPGFSRTFATGTAGANGIAFDHQGNLFISGGASGIVYRVGPGGGSAQAAVQIDKFTRTLPDGKTQQAIVANGVEFDANGVLHVTDTARGAVWKVAIGPDGKGDKPMLLAQSPLLEGADGLAFDRSGKLWVVANERNAIVTVMPDGQVCRSPRTAARDRWSSRRQSFLLAAVDIFPTSIRRGAITWTPTALPHETALAPRSRRSHLKYC